ncbi:hypothetical protein [Salinibius halmophilus]|uniref:hypothetical protein n=1 Tax=Salinibius halmophilus TaxID=1853216 RepID=UPI000E665AED|nr:hypothetical protein [Salinibius halmophilus]
MRRTISDDEVMALLARTGKRYSMAALKVELTTEFGKFAKFCCQGGKKILDIDGMARYLISPSQQN